MRTSIKHTKLNTTPKRNPSPGRSAALVCLGGACYGFNATAYKLAYGMGFSAAQIAAAQMWCSFMLYAILFAGEALQGRERSRIGRLTAAKLFGAGCTTCCTSIFYTYAMSVLPMPLALTLLFQFTWIGTLIQTISTRKMPAINQVASAVIIMFGTVFASGLYRTDLSTCSPLGIAAGLAAAVCCASFLALSGHIQTECSQAQRGLVICAGSVAASHLISPDFLVSGVLLKGIAPLGLVAGACGFFLPVLLFSIGTPSLPTGVTTILAASELPAGLLVAMVVLDEPIGAIEWLGVAIILAGVCISQLQFLPKGSSRKSAAKS
ncbi:MAG: DMT family transporter [Coriobacteriia bacterium]|nr:DMT family transporter [Coriobacteriia bacterium]